MKFIQRKFIPSQSCALCQSACDSNNGLCKQCENTLPQLTQHCQRCALPLTEGNLICGECQTKRPAFDCVRSPLIYQYPVDDLISQFKYHHNLRNGRLLGEYFSRYLKQQSFSINLLIPIPLHPLRLKKRGFNQAAELTHWISKNTGIAWRTDILQRNTHSQAQRRINKRHRQSNVKGIFSCEKQVPKRVAIIDDVVTTGATANAAAHCLKKAGVNWVEIWAMARTPKPGT